MNMQTVNKEQMKRNLAIILFIFLSYSCWGQIYQRRNQESKESLVIKTIGANALQVGRTYELIDSASITIIYFEIKTQDGSRLGKKKSEGEFDLTGGNQFSGKPAVTLFNILHSTDKANYTKYTVDTVSFNSGCCPCHFPAAVDSIMFIDNNSRNELILFLTHTVRSNCNSLTHYSAVFYDNFFSSVKGGSFSVNAKAIYPRHYNMFGEKLEKMLIRRFRELESN